MKTASVTVEQRHVDNGRRSDCLFCPIELSAFEQDGLKDAIVGYGYWLPYGPCAGTFDLPSDTMQFIRDFDADRPVAVPQTFILPLE